MSRANLATPSFTESGSDAICIVLLYHGCCCIMEGGVKKLIQHEAKLRCQIPHAKCFNTAHAVKHKL